MVHNLHIVVGDFLPAPGKEVAVKLIHLGTEFAAAHKEFESAGKEFEAVRIIDFPLPTRLRYPAQEAEDIKRRQEISQARDNAAEVERQAKVKELIAQHSDVQKQLKQLGVEISGSGDAARGEGTAPTGNDEEEAEPAKSTKGAKGAKGAKAKES